MKKSAVLGLVGATVLALGAGTGPAFAAPAYQQYGNNDDPYYNNGYRDDLYRDGSYRDDNDYGGSRQDQYDPRHADRVVRCESRNDRTVYCGSRVDGSVRLVRQMSQSNCVRGRSWGVDRGRLWVSRGCRAQFAINDRYDGRRDGSYGYGQGNGYGNGYGNRSNGRVLVCESRDGRYKFCGGFGNVSQAQVLRQLSDSRCLLNSNWGHRRDGIWVDRGCRAEFIVY